MSFFRKPTPLPVQQGGTGDAYFSAGYALIGNGYSALLELTPSTSGNVMTSNGTTWTSAPPSGGGSGTVNSGTAYQLAYYAASGTAVSTLGSLGTSGQVLTSGGAGVAPTWTTISAVSAATPTALGTVYGSTLDLSGNATTAVGYQALRVNTGSSNVALGATALYTNTSGARNVAVGYGTLYTNNGNENVGIGVAALQLNTSGYYNVAVGYQALQSNTTSSSSTAVGYQALYSSTARFNTAVGFAAGYGNTLGEGNCNFGNNAGYGITTGNNNVCIGTNAGYGQNVSGVNLITGGSGIYVGGYAYPSATSNIYEIVIGYNSAGKGGSTGYINPNGGGVYQGNNQATWSVTSDQRLKKNIVDNNIGLDKIAQIQVRNFEYRTEDEVTELPKHSVIKKEGVQIGAIAQEIIQILPNCVKTETTGVMSLNTDNIMWHMINAIKELNAKVIALETKVGA